LVEYWDLILAVSAAVIVCLLGSAGVLGGDVLTSATLGVLAALAGATVRERSDRVRSSRELRTLTDEVRAEAVAAIQELRDLARISKSEKAWQVIDESTTWDLITTTEATVTVRRRIRFLQSETAAVWEWFRSPQGAQLTAHSCRGALVGHALREWPILPGSFLGDDSRSYRVISTAQIFRRGDLVDWTSERRVTDSFPMRTEGVTRTVMVPTEGTILKVIWPADYSPTGVWFVRGDQRTVLKLDKGGDGRSFVVVPVTSPAVGDCMAIGWDWEPGH